MRRNFLTRSPRTWGGDVTLTGPTIQAPGTARVRAVTGVNKDVHLSRRPLSYGYITLSIP